MALPRLLLLLALASVAVSAPASAPIEVLSNETSGGPDLRALQRILTLLSPAQCPEPYKASAGLCLLSNSNRTTWADAEKACRSSGGHLAWMESAEEHEVIRKFAAKKIQYWFWIGLHRRNGSHVWSSRSDSDYRGAMLIDKEDPCVLAYTNNRKFVGHYKTHTASSVCRTKTGEAPGSILSLLQRTRDQTDALCPYPWRRHKGMCLLYFFTERTWREAEDLCFSQGGAPVWIQSQKEHEAIKGPGWTRTWMYAREFWVGLYKKKVGGLLWSGGFINCCSYKGSPFENQDASFFYSEFKTEKIVGANGSDRKSVVCRRPL